MIEVIGFTGTRQGMTKAQKDAFFNLLEGARHANVFVHGGCKGADRDAHEIARAIGDFWITVRPGAKDQWDFYAQGHQKADDLVEVPPGEQGVYLFRNRLIVADADLMIATPGGNDEEHRSGTWSTIRHTRRMHKHLIIIWPDGSLREESS